MDLVIPFFIASGACAVTERQSRGVRLPYKNHYTLKDQKKADRATKFIGRGSRRSSTAAYALAYGPLANSSSYTKEDVVFISAEGARSSRVPPDFLEILKAVEAGATLITDDAANRSRPYNVGEREVASFLEEQGYQELNGVWRPLAED